MIAESDHERRFRPGYYLMGRRGHWAGQQYRRYHDSLACHKICPYGWEQVAWLVRVPRSVCLVMHQGVGNAQVGKQSAKKATKRKFGAIPGWCPALHPTKPQPEGGAAI